MVEKIILAKPNGFCAGVQRAVDIVDRALELYGKPIYVRHHIVHNVHVVKEFENKGVIFVEEISEVPENSYVVLSAHGSRPEVVSECERKKLNVIDAACPLVKKVHFEAQRFGNDGYSIILIGKKKHQEVVGTSGYANMQIVENILDVSSLEIEDEDRCIYLTQTTLAIDETKNIISALKKKFPKIIAPPKDDICYATTNRQTAIKQLAKVSDLILIIGSKNSSNSNKLRDVAEKYGCEAYLVDDYNYLDLSWFENKKVVGISAGASAPQRLIDELIDYLKNIFENVSFEELDTVKENMFFPLPKELN